MLAPGTWGLDGERGYGQLGAIVEESPGTLTRAFRSLSGVLSPGDMVRVDNFAWRGSPEAALGLPCQDITYPTELGPAPAWFVPGSNDTWVLFLHGKGASPEESLRILPVVHQLGCPALLLRLPQRWRRSPTGPTGRYGYGLTEWRDLVAAIDYASLHGARQVVLYGFSMGAGIALSALQNAAERLPVAALVADSPMIDLRTNGSPPGCRAPASARLHRTRPVHRVDLVWGRLACPGLPPDGRLLCCSHPVPPRRCR
ncbi:MAG: hypothetical protein U5Q44_07505 [Dehalococcoidia bacterium]|nr:hypothetical protein [Dehalococcoidia bacterium]